MEEWSSGGANSMDWESSGIVISNFKLGNTGMPKDLLNDFCKPVSLNTHYIKIPNSHQVRSSPDLPKLDKIKNTHQWLVKKVIVPTAIFGFCAPVTKQKSGVQGRLEILSRWTKYFENLGVGLSSSKKLVLVSTFCLIICSFRALLHFGESLEGTVKVVGGTESLASFLLIKSKTN